MPGLEVMTVDLGGSLEEILKNMHVLLNTQTSSSRLSKEEVKEEEKNEEEEEDVELGRKGRILMKDHDRDAAMSRVGQRVWSGVLLLIGLLACITV